MSTAESILNRVYAFFVDSRDFNGIPLAQLASDMKMEYLDVLNIVRNLVIENKMSVQMSINPNIIGLEHYSVSIQLKFLEEAKKNKTVVDKTSPTFHIIRHSHPICIYPSTRYLRQYRDVTRLPPFTRALSLGGPQLLPIAFEIEVLERYFQDPRFAFEFEDYSGSISYREDENGASVGEKDQIFIQNFGLGTDENGDRVCIVYLRYLKDLTPSHQEYWESNIARTRCKILEEYYQNTIQGEWTNSYSVFSAFLGEQQAINLLTGELFGETMFIQSFDRYSQPQEFTFFFVPTLKNFESFISLFDKMLADNLNRKFFSETGVELFKRQHLEDGTVERVNKGTLTLLSEWILLAFPHQTRHDIDNILGPLKIIRNKRMSPAHKINSNKHDKSYIAQQTGLVLSAYNSLKALRQLLQTNPDSHSVYVQEWLDKGDIKVF